MAYTKKPKTINPDEVDPSVYYYDEVYDEMKDEEKSKVTEQKSSADGKEKKSKYIQGLKETAEQRKTDKEIRKFKRYTRDREEMDEGCQHLSGKDVYITSSYRKKLKEIEKLESERKHLIDNDKDNSMNFTKRNSNRTENDQTTKDKTIRVQDSKSVQSSSKRQSQADIGDSDKDNKHNVEKDESQVDSKPTRSLLKTLEDRRVYLRQILAKRTVGKVYDEAVSRYIERKAQLQK